VHQGFFFGLRNQAANALGSAKVSYAYFQQKLEGLSSNAWDALGATWFGFTTHWVNRQGLPFEALTPKPHFSGADLNSVLSSLNL
jgi:hypothetical protein